MKGEIKGRLEVSSAPRGRILLDAAWERKKGVGMSCPGLGLGFSDSYRRAGVQMARHDIDPGHLVRKESIVVNAPSAGDGVAVAPVSEAGANPHDLGMNPLGEFDPAGQLLSVTAFY